MRPNAKACPEQREQTVHFCVVLRPAKPPRARGLHEMKLSRATGEEEEIGTSPKAGSITDEPLNWEWVKPSCLTCQRTDLQLHPATVNTGRVSI